MIAIPGVPIATWASWSSPLRWTPPWIHDENGQIWIIQFMEHFSTSADIYVNSPGVIEYFLLVCGLLVRDISLGHFCQSDPDDEISSKYPPWITGSCIEFSIVDVISDTVSKVWNKAKVQPMVRPLPLLPPGQTARLSVDPATESLPKLGHNMDNGAIDPQLNKSTRSPAEVPSNEHQTLSQLSAEAGTGLSSPAVDTEVADGQPQAVKDVVRSVNNTHGNACSVSIP